jgi:hypothetical protein
MLRNETRRFVFLEANLRMGMQMPPPLDQLILMTDFADSFLPDARVWGRTKFSWCAQAMAMCCAAMIN